MFCRKIKEKLSEDENSDTDMDFGELDAMQDDEDVAVTIRAGYKAIPTWVQQRSQCSKTCGNGKFPQLA